MKLYLLAGLVSVISLAGCVSGSVSDDLCDSQNLTQLTSVPAGIMLPNYVLPPVSFSQSVNVSNDLSKIKDVAKHLSATITELQLTNSTGNFSWVGSVNVSIESQNDPTDFPLTTLATFSGQDTSSTLNLNPQMSADEIYDYLSSGACSIVFTISDSTTPSQSPNLSATVCVNVEASTKLSL